MEDVQSATLQSDSPNRLPYVSGDLPGIGGRLRVSIEDFQVEEIPAYQPCGQGDHILAWIEKRELTSANVAKELARALDLRESDIGMAGMKDKYAVTRQMFSLPPPTSPEAVLDLNLPGIAILSAGRHGNKLRTGHLKGNRFVVRVRELNCSPDVALSRCEAILETLANVPGAPNWYGAQRFGRAGSNASVGKALVKGEQLKGRKPRGRQRRLYISAYQSQLFNEFLAERISDGLFSTVLAGEVLQKRDSGGMFVSENLEDEQVRFANGELSLTGPMFGHRMKCPAQDSAAGIREATILAREELTTESFAHLSKLANGTRRALAVILDDVRASAIDEGLELQFTLPPGSYATAILREIIKGDEDFPN